MCVTLKCQPFSRNVNAQIHSIGHHCKCEYNKGPKHLVQKYQCTCPNSNTWEHHTCTTIIGSICDYPQTVLPYRLMMGGYEEVGGV